jgi:hypothetical protein
MTSKHHVLYGGRLIALVFLRDDALGQESVLGGIIPFERSGIWSSGDGVDLHACKLRRDDLSREMPKADAVDCMLADAAIEWWKCQSLRYE